MIPFEFEYYKPDSIEETVQLFKELNSQGKKAMYYGGGTEIISMARAYNINTDAIIDIKGIQECNIHGFKDDCLIIGSAVTLTSIAEANFFPLLSLTAQRIADHTIQDKITLGGNIAGTIIYREAVLPLMVSDSEVAISGTNGIRVVKIKDVFQDKININKGEFIVQIIVKNSYLKLPYIHAKRTKNDKIDYPLITLAALKNGNIINIAFSGIFNYPFRSSVLEQYLNDKTTSRDKRINNIINNLSNKILNDLNGSADYRKFMMQRMLSEVLDKFEGMS